MLPPAPVRFSTTTGTFTRSVRRCASIRATTSPPPPAANGTTNLIGLLGYFCCARAGNVEASPIASADSMKSRLRICLLLLSGQYAQLFALHEGAGSETASLGRLRRGPQRAAVPSLTKTRRRLRIVNLLIVASIGSDAG